MVKRPWRTTEIKALCEHYAEHGPTGCAQFLPDRTHAAIKAVAERLGLKTRRRRAFARPLSAAEKVAAAHAARKPVTWREIVRLADEWQVSPYAARGRILRAGGSIRHSRVRWTREQDAVLYASCCERPEMIARTLRAKTGVRRSPKAVQVRLHKLGIGGRTERDGYRGNELARLLGVGPCYVTRRIADGRIAATRQPGIGRAADAVNPAPWLIRHRDVAAWLRAEPAALVKARGQADPLWLADLLGEVGDAQRVKPRRRPTADDGGLEEYHLALGG